MIITKDNINQPAAVRWNLANVDASIIRDLDQILLRFDLYGHANVKVTMLKMLIKEILELPYISKELKIALNKKLVPLKLHKVY